MIIVPCDKFNNERVIQGSIVEGVLSSEESLEVLMNYLRLVRCELIMQSSKGDAKEFSAQQ